MTQFKMQMELSSKILRNFAEISNFPSKKKRIELFLLLQSINPSCFISAKINIPNSIELKMIHGIKIKIIIIIKSKTQYFKKKKKNE